VLSWETAQQTHLQCELQKLVAQPKVNDFTAYHMLKKLQECIHSKESLPYKPLNPRACNL